MNWRRSSLVFGKGSLSHEFAPERKNASPRRAHIITRYYTIFITLYCSDVSIFCQGFSGEIRCEIKTSPCCDGIPLRELSRHIVARGLCHLSLLAVTQTLPVPVLASENRPEDCAEQKSDDKCSEYLEQTTRHTTHLLPFPRNIRCRSRFQRQPSHWR